MGPYLFSVADTGKRAHRPFRLRAVVAEHGMGDEAAVVFLVHPVMIIGY
jgi:hypothetical protein